MEDGGRRVHGGVCTTARNCASTGGSIRPTMPKFDRPVQAIHPGLPKNAGHSPAVGSTMAARPLPPSEALSARRLIPLFLFALITPWVTRTRYLSSWTHPMCTEPVATTCPLPPVTSRRSSSVVEDNGLTDVVH
jgi:hypothetical protein